MNVLTDVGQEAEDKLFATLDTKTARWNLGGGQHVLLSDTVGFVRNLPHRLVASFKATLEEAIHADLLFHVVDSSVRDALRQAEVVKGVLAETGCADKPVLTLLNKIDVAEDLGLLEVLSQKYDPSLRISAKTGRGLDQVFDFVLEAMRPRVMRALVRFSAGDGKLTTLMNRLADVDEQHYEGSWVEMKITMDRTQFEQLQGRHSSLEIVSEVT